MGWRGVSVALGAVAAAVILLRRGRGFVLGHRAAGGILIGDTAAYELLMRPLDGFYRSVADDAARAVAPGARVLDVGCGPGRLSIRLARDHGLDVTGLDLDPAMISRAQANVARSPAPDGGPTFIVGDVAALPFDDASVDLVVSTFSVHHWADPAAGLAEIGRVLRPGGRALVWDFRPGVMPFHDRMPDPRHHLDGTPLRVADAQAWRWPWRLALTQRTELIRDVSSL